MHLEEAILHAADLQLTGKCPNAFVAIDKRNDELFVETDDNLFSNELEFIPADEIHGYAIEKALIGRCTYDLDELNARLENLVNQYQDSR